MIKPDSEAQGYLYEAARFRGLAYFNDLDFEYVRDGGDVRYYVDASDLLVLYIWPGRLGWPRHLRDSEIANSDYISNIGEPSKEEEIAEAALTGEFLFSDTMHSHARGLRQKNTSQPNSRVRRFVLEPHWNELLSALTRFISEGVGATTTDSAGSTKKDLLEEYERAIAEAKDLRRKMLQDYEAAIREGESIPNLDVERLLSPMIGIAAKLENTEMLQRAMVRRFRFSQPVVPALRLSAEIQDIHRNSEALTPWQEELIKLGKSAAVARNDAIAIAQIEALNRKALQAGDKTIHCLVSGDKHLHQAYYNRKEMAFASDRKLEVGQIDLEIGNFASSYYLRHPGQFVPMLNQADLPNQIEDSTLFDEVVAAADAALALVHDSEREALYMALQAVRLPRESFIKAARTTKAWKIAMQNADDIRESSQNLKDSWNRLRRATLLVNRHLLKSRADIAQGLRAELQSNRDKWSEVLQEKQLETTLEIQRETLFLAARRGLSTLSVKLHRKGAGKEDRNRLPNLIELSHLTGGSVFDAAQDLKKGDAELKNRIDEQVIRLSPEMTWQVLMLCSSLACYSDTWSEAAWFAERAYDAIHVDSAVTQNGLLDRARAEAAYLLGYAYRMRLSEGDFFARALDALNKSDRSGQEIGGHIGSLIRARALSERATVYMFEQARRRTKSEELLDGSVMGKQRDTFLESLSIIDSLKEATLDDRERRAGDFVLRQATLNLCIFDAAGHIFPDNFLQIPNFVSRTDLVQEIEFQHHTWRNAKGEATVTDIDRVFLEVVGAYLRDESKSDIQRLCFRLSGLRENAALKGLDESIADELQNLSKRLLEMNGAQG